MQTWTHRMPSSQVQSGLPAESSWLSLATVLSDDDVLSEPEVVVLGVTVVESVAESAAVPPRGSSSSESKHAERPSQRPPHKPSSTALTGGQA